MFKNFEDSAEVLVDDGVDVEQQVGRSGEIEISNNEENYAVSKSPPSALSSINRNPALKICSPRHAANGLSKSSMQ